jgi:nucleoid DNA-binding protein
MRRRPCRHERMIRTRYGNTVKTINPEIPPRQKKEIIDEHYNSIIKELKKEGRVNIKGLGVIKIKKIPARHIPARPAGMRMNPFTQKEQMFPASRAKTKPASKKLKFFASKGLKEEL